MAENPEDVLLNPEPWLPDGARIADLCGVVEVRTTLAPGAALADRFDDALRELSRDLQRRALGCGADAVVDIRLAVDPFLETGAELVLAGTAARLGRAA